MTSSERLAVQRVATREAPDDRVSCLEVDLETDGEDGTVVLSGTVQTERIRRAVAEAVEEASDDDVRDDLSVLAGTGEARTTDRRALSVRGDTDEDAEQVTTVLYGADLTAYDGRDGWRRIRTPGGYLGWVNEDGLADAVGGDADDWHADAVVIDAPADVLDDASTGLERVPAGVDCRLESREGNRVTVSFRTGGSATLPAASVRETATEGTGDDVVALARQLLETPYEWGGMTAEGIDCSGLSSVSYATVGVQLPRDADQQGTMGDDVDREELEAGDLLFFPGHVAISLGGSEYIHAYGTPGKVAINSLDADDDRYVESLDEGLSGAKRLLER